MNLLMLLNCLCVVSSFAGTILSFEKFLLESRLKDHSSNNCFVANWYVGL